VDSYAEQTDRGQHAQRAAKENTAVDRQKFMSFRLDDQVYGLEILKVREIIRVPEISRVPRAAGHIRGVINLRGGIIPVADLRLKLGSPRTEIREHTVIIVVQLESEEREYRVGILVDEVLEVLALAEADIEEPPTLGNGSDTTALLLGIGKSGQRVVFLLDISEVLGRDGVIDLGQLTGTGESAHA